MTRPTPHVLCQQLARHWAANTAVAGGLTFCEAASSARSNLYACPLPVAAHRLRPAASLTLTPAAATDPATRAEAIDIAVEARADTDAGAMALLTDLHELLWPTDGAFIHLATHFGVAVNGVVGIPADGAGFVWLWRVVTLEPVTGPVVIPGGGDSEIRTAEGEAAASMTIAAVCTPKLINWWA